jgi:hypothetical protein
MTAIAPFSGRPGDKIPKNKPCRDSFTGVFAMSGNFGAPGAKAAKRGSGAFFPFTLFG